MSRPVRGVTGLRIAHLIESDGPGGAERVLAHLSTALQAAGAYNVAFLPADGEGWLARRLEGSGVTIEYFREEGPVSPACARSLEVGFRRHRIVVAHSHEFMMAVYGAWAAWRAGVPHVITMHGSSYYAARLRRRLAPRAAIGLSGHTPAASALRIGFISWVFARMWRRSWQPRTSSRCRPCPRGCPWRFSRPCSPAVPSWRARWGKWAWPWPTARPESSWSPAILRRWPPPSTACSVTRIEPVSWVNVPSVGPPPSMASPGWSTGTPAPTKDCLRADLPHQSVDQLT